MADNRLRFVCKACEAAGKEFHSYGVALARLPVGGDWTNARDEQFRERWLVDAAAAFSEFATDLPRDARPSPLGERIAAFINRHRWCDDFNADNFALEWEGGMLIGSGATIPTPGGE